MSTLKVLQGTSRERPRYLRIKFPETSLESQIRTSPERHFKMSLGRQIETFPVRQVGTSPERSNRIFSGRPGDVGVGGPRDVPGTNI